MYRLLLLLVCPTGTLFCHFAQGTLIRLSVLGQLHFYRAASSTFQRSQQAIRNWLSIFCYFPVVTLYVTRQADTGTGTLSEAVVGATVTIKTETQAHGKSACTKALFSVRLRHIGRTCLRHEKAGTDQISLQLPATKHLCIS